MLAHLRPGTTRARAHWISVTIISSNSLRVNSEPRIGVPSRASLRGSLRSGGSWMGLVDRLQVAGITQGDVAKAAGVSRPCVSRMFSGVSPISPRVRTAAEGLLAELPAKLLARAADVLEAQVVAE